MRTRSLAPWLVALGLVVASCAQPESTAGDSGPLVTEASAEPEPDLRAEATTVPPAIDVAVSPSSPSPPSRVDDGAFLVWGDGVLGQWQGDWFQPLEADGRTITVDPTSARSGESVVFEVTLDHACSAAPFGPSTSDGVGVTGLDWDPIWLTTEIQPAPAHVETISEVLAAEGLTDLEPVLSQVIRLDVESDGVDEVLLVASNEQGPLGGHAGSPLGSYTVSVLRRVVDGTVRIEPLYVAVATEDDDPTVGYEYLYPEIVGQYVDNVTFVSAVDVDGDGSTELIMAVGAHEYRGIQVWDNAEAAWTNRLESGCGL